MSRAMVVMTSDDGGVAERTALCVVDACGGEYRIGIGAEGGSAAFRCHQSAGNDMRVAYDLSGREDRRQADVRPGEDREPFGARAAAHDRADLVQNASAGLARGVLP